MGEGQRDLGLICQELLSKTLHVKDHKVMNMQYMSLFFFM